MAKRQKKIELDEKRPWERQEGEPPKSYQAFCMYRDMPYQDRSNILQAYIRHDRSLNAVAKAKGCTPQNIQYMSSVYRWRERSEAYDEHLDELNRQEQEAEIISMLKLHAKIAQQMVNKAARKFLQISESDMSVSDAIKMFEVGVKYERLSRGDTTENQTVNVRENITYTGMHSLIKSLDKARQKLTEG